MAPEPLSRRPETRISGTETRLQVSCSYWKVLRGVGAALAVSGMVVLEIG